MNVVLITLFVAVHSTEVVEEGVSKQDSTKYLDSHCPSWLNNCTSASCEEISSKNRAIQCSAQPEWFVLPCYCISPYYKNKSVLVTGLCPYTCTTSLLKGKEPTKLPMDKSIHEVNESECGLQHREGQLCGLCQEGHAPAVYSYSDECFNCTDYKWNWLKYIGIAYGPQTLFFIVIIFTKTSVTSGWMVGYVTVSQLMLTSVGSRFLSVESKKNYIMTKILSVVNGIWNLDFFKNIYSPFCIHPNQSMLGAISMDYTVALYPLILLVVTYIMMELFSRYTAVKSCCKPINTIRYSYHKYCDFKRSFIDAFAAVWILSYVKVLNTSTELLLFTPLVDFEGNTKDLVVYYNGSMKYMGKEHLPYVMLSALMLLFFNIIPLVLITFYPCRCFQNFLNKKVSSRVNICFIHMVMDVFYRSYKVKQRGCAVGYIYLRIITFLVLLIELSPIYVAVISIVYFLAALIIALWQPHQKMAHNVINAFLLFFLGLMNLMEFLTYTVFTVFPSLLGHQWHLIAIMSLALPVGFILQILIGLLPSCFYKACYRIFLVAKNRVRRVLNSESKALSQGMEQNEYTHLLDVNK